MCGTAKSYKTYGNSMKRKRLLPRFRRSTLQMKELAARFADGYNIPTIYQTRNATLKWKTNNKKQDIVTLNNNKYYYIQYDSICIICPYRMIVTHERHLHYGERFRVLQETIHFAKYIHTIQNRKANYQRYWQPSLKIIK